KEEGDPDKVVSGTEREVITAIEKKIASPTFKTTIRGVYVAKRDVFKSAHKILTRAYFAHFNQPGLNSMKFSSTTRPKTQYVFRKRIPFIRSRRQFRNYVLRFPPLFPDRSGITNTLSPEELSTV